MARCATPSVAASSITKTRAPSDAVFPPSMPRIVYFDSILFAHAKVFVVGGCRCESALGAVQAVDAFRIADKGHSAKEIEFRRRSLDQIHVSGAYQARAIRSLDATRHVSVVHGNDERLTDMNLRYPIWLLSRMGPHQSFKPYGKMCKE